MNFKKISFIALVLVFLGTLSVLVTNYWLEKEIENSSYKVSENNQVIPEEVVEKGVTYIINKGEGHVGKYQITKILEESTVFSLLEELAQGASFEIIVTQYDIGIFIESIGGVQNKQDNKYWQYWVNDKLGEVAADKKKVQEGDKIEWRFEETNF